jgi:hypothetical protein
MFIPGWREGLSEFHRMKKHIAELEAQLNPRQLVMQLKDALGKLIMPINEMPRNLDMGNRQSVADGCITIIEQSLAAIHAHSYSAEPESSDYS